MSWLTFLRLILRVDYYFILRRTTEPFALPDRKRYQRVAIDEESLARLARRFPRRTRRFGQRVRQGLTGYYYADDLGAPHGYCWFVAARDYYEPHYRWTFRLAADEGYAFDAYVAPSRRGTIGTLQAYAELLETLNGQGIRWVSVATHERNRPALRLYLHLGFEIVGCLEVARLFGWAVRARRADGERRVAHKVRAATRGFRERLATGIGNKMDEP